jgi:hypothetical protein
MKDDDISKSHRPKIIICELFTEKTTDVNVRLGEIHCRSFVADLQVVSIVVCEKKTLQNRYLVQPSFRHAEFARTKDVFGMSSYFICKTISTTADPLDPLFAACLISDNGQINDSIVFIPPLDWFRNSDLSAEKPLGSSFTTEFVDDRLEPFDRTVPVL